MSKETIKALRGLMIFATVLILAVLNLDKVFGGIGFMISILRPFLIGAAIAFVVNLPMKFFEHKVYAKHKKLIKWKRLLSFATAIVTIIIVFGAVSLLVIPQLAETIGELTVKIPVFLRETMVLLQKTFEDNPEVQEYIASIDFQNWDWHGIITKLVNALGTGLGSMMISTVSVATSIFNVVFDSVIAFVFAVYVLMQKEVLQGQCVRVMKAYMPEKLLNRTQKILSLLYKNFSNFIASQCLEAVILGVLFVIAMTVFRFPYAVLIGTLISVTALIPIVGAFIGCIVGAFLILVESPVMAVGFVILFLILQQLEGNLIYPRVVGSSVGIPAIWVLVAVSVGGSLFGVIGMLIFIPITSTLYTLLREDVNERNAKK